MAEKNLHEEWRQIPDFPYYEVSNLGRVRSIRRVHKRRHWKTGISMEVSCGGNLLEGWVKRFGGRNVAKMVALRANNKTYEYRVHRLVLEAFVGSCPDGMEGCHNDGNPLNNEVSNLRWDTHQNNMDDQLRHGTKSVPPTHYGEAHPHAKMTDAEIAYVRSLKIEHGGIAKLARRYDVSHQTMRRILNGTARCQTPSD